METARKAIIGREVLPVCKICPKINSRTFESEDERQKHTAVEFYKTYLGEDYEKEMAAVAEVHFSSNYSASYRSDCLSEIPKIRSSYWDKVDRLWTACKYCRGCYREYDADPTLTRQGEMLDIVGTERPLLFDPRVFIQTIECQSNELQELVKQIEAEEDLPDGSESDEMSLDRSESDEMSHD